MPGDRYYDPENLRLIFLGQAATAKFWDERWSHFDIEKEAQGHHNKEVVRHTRRYLPLSSTIRILEGGCGTGGKVHALARAGYTVTGIDYAEKTVSRMKRISPELDIRLGDVRKLDFDDAYFDGYWSLGVIEHFWDGYDSILSEASRVVRQGGYLFLVFPYMSPIRKLKAALRLYPPWHGTEQPEDFYQFALDVEQVRGHVKFHAFELLEVVPRSAGLGLAHEVPPLDHWVNAGNRNIVLKAFLAATSVFLRGFSGHSCLLVCRKL